MAKIYQEQIVINLSKLVKTSETSFDAIANSNLLDNLESIVQELVEADIIVEVTAGDSDVNF